jgi:Zn-dependent peptidase ImmA (M78 family)/transcriptional regulator with XRE-family HTH domain
MIGERIKQARLAAGMTQDEVSESLATLNGPSLTKAGLSKYERGGSVPKPTMLRALARVFGVSAEFFLEEPKVSVRWLAFRKGSSLRKGEEKQIKAVAAAQVEAFVTLLNALEPQREPRALEPMAVRTPEDAENAASRLRSSWRLGDQPVESVTSAIEDGGGLVLELGGREDVFDGLSGWADESIPIVVVSQWVSDDRRRFSLAHESGHLFMETKGVDARAQEKLAHRFAAAFLVPAETARRELGERRRHLDFRELALLKIKHGLSMAAWIMRATDLGIIDDAHARTLFTRLSAKGWRRQEPVQFEGRERPLRLRQLTVRALAEGLITREQAERICPQALSDLGEVGPAAPGSMDARTLLKLPKEERDRLMEQAALLVEGDYQTGGGLTGFDALSEEDHSDKSLED